MIIENRMRTGVEFRDLSVGEVFKVYDNIDIEAYANNGMDLDIDFYLKIQETETGYNAINLNANKIASFSGKYTVYPVHGKLIITS